MATKSSTGKKPRKCRPPLSQGTPTLPVLGRIDGRTMAALAFRKALDDFVGDLGGDENITRAELEIARRAAGLAVLAAAHEVSILAGKPIDVPTYLNLINTQRHVLLALGLSRRPKDITPNPIEYLEAKNGKSD